MLTVSWDSIIVQRSVVSTGPPPIFRRGSSEQYPKDPWPIYWVHYIGGSASVLTEELGLSRGNPRLTIGNSGIIGKQFLALADSFRRGHGFPHLYSASAILQNLCAHLIEAKSYRIPLKANHFSIEELLAYLMDNTDKDLKLDDLSRKAGISRFHLSRQFSEATGISPMAYFHQLKIRKACELLDTTGLCIKEISLSLGFRSPYYFSESFKRVMGISPTAYRKSGKA